MLSLLLNFRSIAYQRLIFVITGISDFDILYRKNAERINRLSVNANGPIKRPKAEDTGDSTMFNISIISRERKDSRYAFISLS